jgi:hypothetical protein
MPLAAAAREGGIGELVEQHVRLAVEDAVAVMDEGAGEGLREMTLAGAGRAEEDRVLALAEETAGGELEDEAAIHLLVEVEVEAVERLVGVAELRLFEPASEQPVGAARELVLDEEREEVGGREVIGLGLEKARLEALGHAAEGELAERAEEFRELHRHRLLPAEHDPEAGRGRG